MEAASTPPHCICYLASPSADQLLQPPSPVPVRGCRGDRPPTKAWPLPSSSLKPAALTYCMCWLTHLGRYFWVHYFRLHTTRNCNARKMTQRRFWARLWRAEARKEARTAPSSPDEREHIHPRKACWLTFTETKLPKWKAAQGREYPIYGCSIRKVKTQPRDKWLQTASRRKNQDAQQI